MASLLLTLSLCLITAYCKPVLQRPQITLDSGIVSGTLASPSVHQFLGIPFGHIAERFEKATLATISDGTLDASSYKPSCMQQFNYPEENRRQQMDWFNTPPPPVPDNEHCLNLNIYAPAGAEPGSKPVLFWIYGGGFLFGSNALPLYDGASLAENQDIVVVTVNYRLNVFGFPGSDQIPEEEQNLGLALEWVQRNIRAFGGDPDRVTIAGESAGATSVDALVTHPPEGRVPFRAAIMQSGQASVYFNQDSSAESWKKLVKLAGCDGKDTDKLQCIKKVPANKLRDICEKNALPFGPINDDVTWDQTPRLNRLASASCKSKIARVPVLIGSNAEEGTLFEVGKPKKVQKAFTKLTFQCPAALVADDSIHVGIPAWRYYFNATFPNTQVFPGSGAYHSSEISLIFGTYPQKGATSFQKGLSDGMQKAWADFVKDPQAGPGWDKAPLVAVFNGRDSQKVPGFIIKKQKTVDKSCAQERLIYGATGVKHVLTSGFE